TCCRHSPGATSRRSRACRGRRSPAAPASSRRVTSRSARRMRSSASPRRSSGSRPRRSVPTCCGPSARAPPAAISSPPRSSAPRRRCASACSRRWCRRPSWTLSLDDCWNTFLPAARRRTRASRTWCAPPPAAESYLNIDAVLAAAKASGAEAIHPGYGFLAENDDFATACQRAGLVFIGPSPEAIAAMGDKSAAKRLMEKAGVPAVPGYHGEKQDAAFLAKEADRIGYPVLIKPSAGGGGKGMRIVSDRKSFAAALEGARREAKSAFGDERVLIERYLER